VNVSNLFTVAAWSFSSPLLPFLRWTLLRILLACCLIFETSAVGIAFGNSTSLVVMISSALALMSPSVSYPSDSVIMVLALTAPWTLRAPCSSFQRVEMILLWYVAQRD
jgi:hypothetical protein